MEVLSLITSGVNLNQTRLYHQEEVEKAEARHKNSIDLAKKQHKDDLATIKKTYLLELFNSLEQHFQQLNSDLISSSRESERDMFDQRNQSFQTIILASSIMFSALSTVIVQGYLPEPYLSNSTCQIPLPPPECLSTAPRMPLGYEFLYVLYSLSCALSFAFLLVGMVLCIEVMLRASSFMYDRAREHTRQLHEAMDKTSSMMKKLRGEDSNRRELADMDEEKLTVL
jgi:hypothetical protein